MSGLFTTYRCRKTGNVNLFRTSHVTKCIMFLVYLLFLIMTLSKETVKNSKSSDTDYQCKQFYFLNIAHFSKNECKKATSILIKGFYYSKYNTFFWFVIYLLEVTPFMENKCLQLKIKFGINYKFP